MQPQTTTVPLCLLSARMDLEGELLLMMAKVDGEKKSSRTFILLWWERGEANVSAFVLFSIKITSPTSIKHSKNVIDSRPGN